MATAQEQKNKELKVSVHLTNREERVGYLIHFDPQIQRLAMHIDSDEIRYFDVPKVAYIAFNRSAESSIPLLKLENLEKAIVHTVTGDQLLVRMVKPKPHDTGFFGFIEEKDALFDHYYFYTHGVRNLEHPKSIGQILVDEKLVSSPDVEQALTTQEILQKRKLGEILVEQQNLEPVDVEQIVTKHGKKRKPIGVILIEAGLITEEDLQKALLEQSKNRSLKIGEVLIQMGFVTEEELISSLAKKFNLPFVDLDDRVINPELIELFDINLLLRFQVLPISSNDDTLTVASSDPMNFDAFDAIRFQTTKHITEVLATPTQIQKLIGQKAGAQSGEEDDWLWVQQIADDREDGGEDEALEIKAAGAQPIVRLVNKVLLNALKKGVSDIHVLPQAKELIVLYRINGDLQRVMTLEKWVQRRMVSRIKLLSGMNIADHRVTQDGRMMVRHEGGLVEFRVSCIPNAFGESIVMRVLNKEMAANLENLGVSEKDRRTLAMMVRKPFGLILATGPTGSGKSTTLFALVQSIIDLPLHIITIEDPVESEIKGANQIQINAKVGLTFASVLRNVLRHDPDVIMVGEMRDKETTSIGVEAALTGHLMLSTLHTNSAVDTVIRLQDLGVPDYLLAPALRGIISQNLVKRLCKHCQQPFTDEHDEVYEILDNMGFKRPKTLYQPGQCDQCGQTGFTGRVMVYEFLEVTENVRNAIHNGKIGSELQKIAESEGMVPKARHALSLAENGVICRDDLIKLLI